VKLVVVVVVVVGTARTTAIISINPFPRSGGNPFPLRLVLLMGHRHGIMLSKLHFVLSNQHAIIFGSLKLFGMNLRL
jgi:hypothetical protein